MVIARIVNLLLNPSLRVQMTSMLIIISLIAGLLIGAIGVGGVLLVPGLTYIVDIEVHRAIPACMLSFLPTGLIALVVYARHGSIRWPLAGWLCLGALPGAYLGAVALPYVSAHLVMALIAGLMVFAGSDSLFQFTRKLSFLGKAEALGAGCYLLLGVITGFGSAMSGTGGPLILVPVLLYLGLPLLHSVGLSQAVQIPIALSASVGNWSNDSLDWALASVISVALTLGALIGALVIHRLPAEPLRRFVAVFIILVGLAVALRLALSVA